MLIKRLLKYLGITALFCGLVLITLLVWLTIESQHASRELDGNYMRCSAMGQVFDGVFEALRQFKSENGYLPPEDNKSVTAALSGKNKISKNYVPGWNENIANEQILDIDRNPLVFHFINDNEMTVYAPATKQLYHGYLNSDKATVTQETAGDQK